MSTQTCFPDGFAMENRRQHYRHEFAPTRPMAVRLQSAEAEHTIIGDAVALSWEFHGEPVGGA